MAFEVVHGSGIDVENHQWLFENGSQFQLRVRQLLVMAVRGLPAGEKDRGVALAGLYEPTDEDRGRVA